jgi:hypothetical protein
MDKISTERLELLQSYPGKATDLDIALMATEILASRKVAQEARIKALEEALRPFGEYLDHMPVDVDNNGVPGPDSEGVGWVYLTCGDFRRARATLNSRENKD